MKGNEVPEEMTTDKIKKLSSKNPNLNPYKQEAAMFDDITVMVDKYSGIISTVAALGVLELAKQYIIDSTKSK